MFPMKGREKTEFLTRRNKFLQEPYFSKQLIRKSINLQQTNKESTQRGNIMTKEKNGNA